MNKFLSKINNRFLSKWIVLLMDIFIVGISYILSSTIRFNFELTYHNTPIFKYHLLWVVFIRTISFIYFQTYTGIIRHSGFEDTKKLLRVSFVSSFILYLISFLPIHSMSEYAKVPISIIFIDFFVLSFGLIANRLTIKSLYESLLGTFKSNRNVMIYGAGDLGRIAKSTLLNDPKHNYQIICFIDDNPNKIGMTIEGIKLVSKKKAKEILLNYKASEVELVFAIQSISPIIKSDLVEEFLELGTKIRIVPPIKNWINGNLSSSQIKDIKIEDLLERPPIQINNRLLTSSLSGKRILVTGAAGSIGSEIVRQILNFGPKEVFLLDQAESPLYDLESELVRYKKYTSNNLKISLHLINISDSIQMERLFLDLKPQIVFHAAAYKHVPLMEAYPLKALEVNSFGTSQLADLASKYKVEKFVFISTDKAVNPTNVMGASKRLAEKYVQSINSHHSNDTRFIITRFGNVLGSSGSVIPLFKKQIENGGPVTVTDPNIIRFFMTIPEACQLVLEAGTMGKGGEIFVFDMGVPVRIIDLAEKMIKLSGFEPYNQIPIVFTGLRPGEKLYEEVLSDQETTIPTHHPKIMIARITSNDFSELKSQFDDFRLKLSSLNTKETVLFLKKMVPEYISNNSPFEVFDN